MRLKDNSNTTPTLIEVNALREDGSEFSLELTLSTWDVGETSFDAAIIRDITGRKLAERQVEELYSLRLAMQEPLSLSDCLDRVLKGAKAVLDFERLTILLSDPEGKWLTVVAVLGSEEPLEPVQVPLGPEGGGIAKAFQEQREIVWKGTGPIPDEWRLAHPYSDIAALRSHSFAIVPMIARGTAIGVMGADNKSSHKPITGESVRMLRTFAAEAALAIENSHLFTAVQERAERIGAINRLISIINSSLDLGAIFEAFSREVMQLILCDRMGFVVPDESGEGLMLAHLVGKQSGAAERGTHWPKSAGTGIDWVMSNRQPHVSRDLIEERQFVEDEFLLKEGIRSSIRLPLVAKGQAIGALFLDSFEPARFSERDLNLLVPIGEQLAVAIENARLYAEAQRREREITKLYDVTSRLASTLDLGRVLDHVTAMAIELVRAEASGIYMYDDARGGLVFSRGLRMDPELTRNLVVAPGEGVSGRAFLERRPVWTRDRFADPSLRYPPATLRLLKARAPRACLGVPIIGRDEVYGVLMAYFLMPHDFTPRQVQVLSALADHAAIAIDNARLHTDLGESKRKIEELYSLGVTMQEQMGLEERFELILKGARTVLGFDRITILLADPGNTRLDGVASLGVEEPIGQISVPIGPEGGGIAKAFLEGKDIVWGSSGPVPNEWRLAHPYSEIRAFRSKSFAIVPLIVRGVAIGVVGADNKLTQRPISNETVRLLKTFAGQAALAIENARLFEQVCLGRERLQTLSRRRLEVQEVERQRLARELHDEIGQALTVVKINFQAMQCLIEDERLVSHLSESIGIVDRAIQQVRNLSLKLRPSILDDLGLVAALRWQVDYLAQRAGLTGQFMADPPDLRAQANIETACFRVAQEALTNVVRHAHARRMSVELRQRQAHLELFVHDDGVGFDVGAMQERAACGESFGLLSLQERVHLAGGQITIESTSGRGTTIRAHFPLTLPLERRGGKRAGGGE